MRPDIVPGKVFPDYQLPDHTDTPRKLSELQGDDPLILTLARGHYCPKEHQQHLELAAFYPKIAVAYTQVATISTDDHHTLQEFRASVGAQWPFLSDPKRTVQKDLDIEEYTDPEHNPMIPHTIVLKPGLIIHRIYNGYWFWGRPSVVDLWHDLREVTREIRPDWDLSSPGLREKWNAGDLTPFHGWNKGDQKPPVESKEKGWTASDLDAAVEIICDLSRCIHLAFTYDPDSYSASWIQEESGLWEVSACDLLRHCWLQRSPRVLLLDSDHEFLVDERDGKGLGDGSKAKIKQIFKITLTQRPSE
jgi:peroxiredoxin